MKQLRNHPFMDRRTVKAWETNGGGYVQIYDIRDIMHGCYSVERAVHGGMDSIYMSPNISKCIDRAMRYAEEN